MMPIEAEVESCRTGPPLAATPTRAALRADGKEVCLLSLAELMREYNVFSLAMIMNAIVAKNRDLAEADRTGTTICDDARMNQLLVVMNGLAAGCALFDADNALLAQVNSLAEDIQAGRARRDAVLEARLREIHKGLEANIENRKFMYVPAEQAKYWESPFLRGFLKDFPEAATIELVETGNCYAAGRATACVFHCMRVAEYGLRKIARQVGVSLRDRGKPQPIEFATWDKVITAINNKIVSTRQLSLSARKNNRLQYYSDVADNATWIRDLWRNEISHSRKIYNLAEAEGVMDRVRDFLQLIMRGVPR